MWWLKLVMIRRALAFLERESSAISKSECFLDAALWKESRRGYQKG